MRKFAFEGHKSLAVTVFVSGSRCRSKKPSQLSVSVVAGADFLCKDARAGLGMVPEPLGVWRGSLQGFGDGETALRPSAPWIVPRTEQGILCLLPHPCQQLRDTKDLYFPGNNLGLC